MLCGRGAEIYTYVTIYDDAIQWDRKRNGCYLARAMNSYFKKLCFLFSSIYPSMKRARNFLDASKSGAKSGE